MYVPFALFDFSVVREVECMSVIIAVLRVVVFYIFFVVIDNGIVCAFLHLIDLLIDGFKDMRIPLAHCAGINFFALTFSNDSVDHYSRYDKKSQNDKRHTVLLF